MAPIRPSLILQTFVLLAYIALVTFLPSVQFMPKSIVWFSDGQRLLELTLLSLVLLDAMLIGFSKSNLMPINKKLRGAFFLLLALVSISTYLAQSPRRALIETSVFIGLSYLALFVVRLYNANKEAFIKALTYSLWASIALYMVSFYAGYITTCVLKIPLLWPLPFTGFSNIRSFNQYQLWSLGLIGLPLLAFELKINTRRWLHLALACWWVLLFYSASRGVLIAWLAGLLMTAIVYKKLAWPFLCLQLTNMAAGFCGYYLLFKVIPILLQSTLVTMPVIRTTINDRIELWNQAIILIKNFPLFGVGPMHYAWYNTTNAHPHNSVLQLAAEWGLPATLIVLSITGYGLYSWLKRFNAKSLPSNSKLDNHLAIVLFFTFIANAAYSLVDGVIVTSISQVMMFTTIGLMIGQYTYGHLAVIKNKPMFFKGRATFRPIFAGLVLVAMIWSTLPEVAQGLSGNEKGFSMGYLAAGPRFWHEIK